MSKEDAMKKCFYIKKLAEKVNRMKRNGEFDIPQEDEGAFREEDFEKFKEKLIAAIDRTLEKKEIPPESLYLTQNRPFTLIEVK